MTTQPYAVSIAPAGAMYGNPAGLPEPCASASTTVPAALSNQGTEALEPSASEAATVSGARSDRSEAAAERVLLPGVAGGRKALVPYVTGGVTAGWTDYLLAFEAAGADAIEIGLPFSDPMLDGATIQEASDHALARGATVASILADISATEVGVPLVVMTYANLVFRAGAAAFCRRLAEAGVAGLIVSDLPVDEVAEVQAAAAAAGIALVLLVAPVTPDDRLAEIARRASGYLYAISVMGTTGERDALAGTAVALAARVKAVSDLPVLVGFGISTPAQAAEAATVADGVVVASVLMRRILDGATPDELAVDIAGMRRALG